MSLRWIVVALVGTLGVGRYLSADFAGWAAVKLAGIAGRISADPDLVEEWSDYVRVELEACGPGRALATALEMASVKAPVRRYKMTTPFHDVWRGSTGLLAAAGWLCSPFVPFLLVVAFLASVRHSDGAVMVFLMAFTYLWFAVIAGIELLASVQRLTGNDMGIRWPLLLGTPASLALIYVFESVASTALLHSPVGRIVDGLLFGVLISSAVFAGGSQIVKVGLGVFVRGLLAAAIGCVAAITGFVAFFAFYGAYITARLAGAVAEWQIRVRCCVVSVLLAIVGLLITWMTVRLMKTSVTVLRRARPRETAGPEVTTIAEIAVLTN